MVPKVSQVYLLAGGVVLAAVAYVYFRGVKETVAGITSVALDAVDGVVSETVITAGEKIGIPRTNISKCEAAKRAGDTWEASFQCPAADFVKWVYNGKPTSGASGTW